jgi:hypothetical protein
VLSKCVFVTKALVGPANFTSAAAADSLCQQAATAAGLPGVFMAWVSDSTSSPSTRFTQSPMPYRTTTGLKVANSWSSLVVGLIANPIDVSEIGTSVTNQVWTGTATNGTATANTCNSWTSTSATGTAGLATAINATWTNDATVACTQQLSLYCFEQ